MRQCAAVLTPAPRAKVWRARSPVGRGMFSGHESATWEQPLVPAALGPSWAGVFPVVPGAPKQAWGPVLLRACSLRRRLPACGGSRLTVSDAHCVHAASLWPQSSQKRTASSSPVTATATLLRSVTRALSVSPPSHPVSLLSSEFITMPWRCQAAGRLLPQAAPLSWEAPGCRTLGQAVPWASRSTCLCAEMLPAPMGPSGHGSGVGSLWGSTLFSKRLRLLLGFGRK